MIDEVQRMPRLFVALRPEIDADRRTGRFLLLGSASGDLLRQAGEDGGSLVERLLRLYAGSFLRGEDDAPWALQFRERLHVALVKKMSVLAADALAHDRIELAHDRIELAHEIYGAGLEIDDLVEEFYRGQIQCHVARDQPSLAVTTYRRCQRALSNRLGVEPSQATTLLYLSAIRAAGG